MTLAETGGRNVRVSYHRTYNLGNYNSLKMGMEIEEWVSEEGSQKGYEDALAEECKEMVLEQIENELRRLKKIK